MNLKRCSIPIAFLFAAVLITACRPQPTSPISHSGPVTDYVSLVDNMRTTGATVEPASEIPQDFFSIEGQVIKVDGADVQVFEYGSEAVAKEEAALVSSSGSTIGTTMVTWVATPHFYKAGRLIVLYVGDNDLVTAVLEEVLGLQFAGG